jgi:hypothetical protein
LAYWAEFPEEVDVFVQRAAEEEIRAQQRSRRETEMLGE